LVAGAVWIAGASRATEVNARLAGERGAAPLPFSLGEKVADEVGRMRDLAKDALNPHPRPLSRRRGESRVPNEQGNSPRVRRAAPLPFSPGEKVARKGVRKNARLSTGYDAG
jgi:hypothetical protein